jgi:hypothetical protein
MCWRVFGEIEGMEDWKTGRLDEWKDGRLEEWKVGRMGGAAPITHPSNHQFHPIIQPSNLPCFLVDDENSAICNPQ